MANNTTLSPKQTVFLEEFARSLHPTKAASKAYPGMAYGTVRSYSSYLCNHHPVISLKVQQIRASAQQSVDPALLVASLVEMYHANAWKTKKYITIANGSIIEREVDCNPLALRALALLVEIFLYRAKING